MLVTYHSIHHIERLTRSLHDIFTTEMGRPVSLGDLLCSSVAGPYPERRSEPCAHDLHRLAMVHDTCAALSGWLGTCLRTKAGSPSSAAA